MTREEAIEILRDTPIDIRSTREDDIHTLYATAQMIAIESLSADEEEENGTFVNRDYCNFNCNDSNRTLVEPKWITDSKPKEDGTYMVTLDAFGQHRYIDLMHYGKPIMPNRKARGECWYRSDDEWGDVVYDDEEILAWLPLPKPYRESEVEK